MNSYDYEKVNNFQIFSPRLEDSSRKLELSNKNNGFNEYSRFSKIGNNNPINLYYSPKNISNPKNSKIPKIYSPLHRKLNRLYRSSSQNNFDSRPLSCNSRALPSVQSFSNIKSPKSRNTNKNKTKNARQNYFNLEKEKLYQETYQIKKIVNILTKKLSLLKQENFKRDNQIKKKQKKINDIININNDSLYENNYLYINNNNNSFNDFSINSSINSISISSNLNKINNKNNSTIKICIKIKKAINQLTNEIKKETEKYEKLKRSLFLTKINELKVESNLLEEQVIKINAFIKEAFLVQEENKKKKEEYLNLKENIDKQKDLIKNLEERSYYLEKEENELNENFNEIKKDLNLRNKKININKNKIKILQEKNNNLSDNKNILKQPYTIKIDNNPIEIKSFYKNQVSKLNKLINFYTSQCKYSDNEINKLKEKVIQLIGTDKEKKSNKKEFDLFSINKNSQNISDNEKINNLKEILKNSLELENKLKKKLNLYQNKLKEIENPQDPDDLSNKSQIEFGIDNDNPYYIDDNENMPEISNKFTSSQFNQFTYILFKNFESKGISFEETKNKVLINQFIEFNKNNNVSNIAYPSNEFNLIVEGYTKIIMEVLNCNNKYNYALTKIFISALFYNSECNVNKLIEYFNILFSYTKNYKLDEEKFLFKLKSKYREQTKKLITSIKESILNDSNSQKYFHLLKMKDLLEHNEINLKDKYIEFLFYYMKKYDDPEAKLGDLKFSLLNDIIPNNELGNENSNNINIINGNEDNINNKKENQKEEIKENPKNLNNTNKKKEKPKKNIDNEGEEFKKNEKRSITEENFSKKSKKINTNDKDNSDDLEDDDESMTEITNEEYIKQLKEAITLMQKGLKDENTNFEDLMTNVVQKRKINGIFYECITIEDFNDQLKSINVVLSDLKLSCLCSKYSVPKELRLIDKNKIEKDIEKYIKGILKLEEEENDNSN